jgi:hypothetical protein
MRSTATPARNNLGNLESFDSVSVCKNREARRVMHVFGVMFCHDCSECLLPGSHLTSDKFSYGLQCDGPAEVQNEIIPFPSHHYGIPS